MLKLIIVLLILPFAASSQRLFKNPGQVQTQGVDQTPGDTTSVATVGINTQTPMFTLDVVGSDGIAIPSGTTAQRPANPRRGLIRYNTTRGRFEGFNGTRWVNLSL